MSFYFRIRDRIQGKAPKGAERSDGWRQVRKDFIKLHKGRGCWICPRKTGLEVHHNTPFHVAPDLEEDPSNLSVLCHRCHLIFGHLGDYKSVNTEIENDIVLWSTRIERAKGNME